MGGGRGGIIMPPCWSLLPPEGREVPPPAPPPGPWDIPGGGGRGMDIMPTRQHCKVLEQQNNIADLETTLGSLTPQHSSVLGNPQI